MRIAQLAPLWESVPPKTYGGTELVAYLLCEEFVKRGHSVTLYSSGDSKTSAKLDPITKISMREAKVEFPWHYELQAIAKLIKDADKYDIIHNHMGYQLLPFVDLINVPVITTLHGAFVNKEDIEFINRYKHLSYISISNSQRAGAPFLNYKATVYNGIDVNKYTFQSEPETNNPYLAFLGRLSKEKGTHLAIKLAKETGFKLIIAGKIGSHDISYYESEVKHLIDNKQIIYIGELGHDAKVELLKGAYATVHPVTWPEPFGLVMAESMACGTPVLAINKGSIPEVIKDKITGFVGNDIDTLIKRVKDIEKINRINCRKHVEDNFSAKKMADGYLAVYKDLINQAYSEINLKLNIPSVSMNLKNL